MFPKEVAEVVVRWGTYRSVGYPDGTVDTRVSARSLLRLAKWHIWPVLEPSSKLFDVSLLGLCSVHVERIEGREKTHGESMNRKIATDYCSDRARQDAAERVGDGQTAWRTRERRERGTAVHLQGGASRGSRHCVESITGVHDSRLSRALPDSGAAHWAQTAPLRAPCGGSLSPRHGATPTDAPPLPSAFICGATCNRLLLGLGATLPEQVICKQGPWLPAIGKAMLTR